MERRFRWFVAGLHRVAYRPGLGNRITLNAGPQLSLQHDGWGRLLLAWSAGPAAASLAPTPFGLGVVDIALISALAGSGLRSPDAVGAVILYRIITFKILVTLVWIGYRYIHRARERARSGARCAGH